MTEGISKVQLKEDHYRWKCPNCKLLIEHRYEKVVVQAAATHLDAEERAAAKARAFTLRVEGKVEGVS